MEILTVLLASVGILWFLDEALTILDVKKFGISREENLLVRWMIKHGPIYFTAFKVFSFVVFVGIVLSIKTLHHNLALVLTSLSALMYLIVVVRNFEVYEEVV